jgi:WD40 repeat protein
MRLLSNKSGFGDIYEAYEGAIPKILKVLKPSHNDNPKVVQLFQQEAAVLAAMKHNGIPQVEVDGYFQFFPKNTEPVHCIIMEKIEGINLKQWMHQQGNHPISENLALNWLKQLVEVIHLLHKNNYFHRDIKPDNIMMRSNGELVLIDFGTAREMTYTYLSAVSGTGVTKISSPGYTPPEQEMGQAVPQSDFYALGRTFVYLLTGQELTHHAIYDVSNNELQWRKHAPGISGEFGDFIDKLIAYKVVARYKTTQEILDNLNRITHKSFNSRIVYNSTKKQSNSISKTSKKWIYLAIFTLISGIGIFYYYKYIRTSANISLTKTIKDNSFVNCFINCLVFSPDGQKLFSASIDKNIKIWDVNTGKLVQTLPGHEGFINYLAISGDGQKLFSASADKSIKIWNLSNGKLISKLTGYNSYVNSLAISPDGQKLFSAGADKTIRVWNIDTKKEIKILQGHTSYVNSLVISPDGKKLYSASADQTIKVWNTNTYKNIQTLHGHTSFVNFLVISPNGEKLFSAGADKTIRVWDTKTYRNIQILQGHQRYVDSLAISNDEQKLISSSDDRTIKIWDLSTGKYISIYADNVKSLAVSRDGQMIATSGVGKDIKIWQKKR